MAPGFLCFPFAFPVVAELARAVYLARSDNPFPLDLFLLLSFPPPASDCPTCPFPSRSDFPTFSFSYLSTFAEWILTWHLWLKSCHAGVGLNDKGNRPWPSIGLVWPPQLFVLAVRVCCSH